MKNNQVHIKHLIHDYVEGKLSEAETDNLWAHLIANPADLEYLQTLAALKKMGQEGAFELPDDQTAEIRDASIHHQHRPMRYAGYIRYYVAAAAVLLLSIGILFTIVSDTQTDSVFNPIAMIEYEIERSADEITNLDMALNSAISHSISGEPELALELLKTIENGQVESKEMIYILMLKGAIRYNASEFLEAIETYKRVLQMNPEFQTMEKAYWYLANAQLQAGLIDEAKENVEKVIELDGAFSRVANMAISGL